MKVYFISSGLQGCYTVRCLLPLNALGANGDQTSIRLDEKTPENKAKAAQDAEIVVFHRPEDDKKLKLARMLKSMGKKIVFDNDDTYKDDRGFKFNEYMDKQRLEHGLKTLNENIDAFIAEADLVTCSTEFLAIEYRKLSDNVVVLPNCIDPFYFDEPKRNETDVVRIGIVGSIAVTSDLDLCIPIIKHFEPRKDVQMVLFSMPIKEQAEMTRRLYHDEYLFLDSCTNLEWQPFVMMEDYYETLNDLKLDIMIIPRSENYFNQCKSNLKFLEASMFEIPVIAQGFSDGTSPYETDPEDAKHMIIVKDNWIEEIEKLIKDKDKRIEMGKKAHEYVEEKYDIEKNIYKWKEAYNLIK